MELEKSEVKELLRKQLLKKLSDWKSARNNYLQMQREYESRIADANTEIEDIESLITQLGKL